LDGLFFGFNLDFFGELRQQFSYFVEWSHRHTDAVQQRWKPTLRVCARIE
jgi:hypothetical protein